MPLLSPVRRQRVLQIGFSAAGLAAVLLGDRMGALLAGGADATLSVLAGRVVGGWALGVAFRLQFTRSARPDPQLRWMLGVPAAALTLWPLVASVAPSGLRATFLGRLMSQATSAAGFAAIALGLTLALSVTGQRRRS